MGKKLGILSFLSLVDHCSNIGIVCNSTFRGKKYNRSKYITTLVEITVILLLDFFMHFCKAGLGIPCTEVFNETLWSTGEDWINVLADLLISLTLNKSLLNLKKPACIVHIIIRIIDRYLAA